jgi:hypothetical protein
MRLRAATTTQLKLNPVPTAENTEGLMTAYDLLAEQAASEEAAVAVSLTWKKPG